MPTKTLWHCLQHDKPNSAGSGATYRRGQIVIQRLGRLFPLLRTSPGLHIPVEVPGHVALGLSGLFTMIPYTEHAHGVYHVMGGLSRITHAFAEFGREEGAEIHTSAPVARVLVDGRRAIGVDLQSGERVYCDDVIINADFGHAMATLFDEKDLGRYKPSTLRKRKFSCSTFMMYLGLNRAYDAEHHTIVFARDYKKNIEAIMHGRRSFEDMSIYVRNSCKTDPSGAPPGHSALYILVPVPNNTSGIDGRSTSRKCGITFFALCASALPMEI